MAELELKDFVADALKQVISGVKEAQDFANAEGALVNPRGYGQSNPTMRLYTRDGATAEDRTWYGQPVDFDVAVTTAERDTAEGGAGVILAVLSVGFKGKEETESGAVSRIRFSVPVFLPRQIHKN